MGTNSPPGTLDALLRWLAAAPLGTTVDAAALHGLLLEFLDEQSEPEMESVTLQGEPTWREKLWTVPPETRLGVAEVAEAIGRSKSWLYKRTGPKATERIPCRRLDGELVFVAGEVRRWLGDHEEVIEPGEPERVPLRAVRP